MAGEIIRHKNTQYEESFKKCHDEILSEYISHIL